MPNVHALLIVAPIPRHSTTLMDDASFLSILGQVTSSQGHSMPYHLGSEHLYPHPEYRHLFISSSFASCAY